MNLFTRNIRERLSSDINPPYNYDSIRHKGKGKQRVFDLHKKIKAILFFDFKRSYQTSSRKSKFS
jgi:hypothetical protein